ncbi:uncharacterized protein LOC105801003 [Gossypium raimondii]|uniref:uncharacterized protein LOC105801003 n=1 Tax=Gossypium raimondii TaxID=29730 RepID=UPI00063AFE8C|nr:uncharacterized protein LOC105801003 [Gossypium raimondii]
MNFQVGSGSSPENNPANPIVPDFDEEVEKEKTKEELPKQLKERWKCIEEKFKAMETTERCHGIDTKDLSLVPDLVLPYKFKMPDFEKYNGTTCPEAHITMFCRQMTWYVNNDQLLIHCFQDSLTGAASKWYNQLSCAKISSWRDIAQAFMKQYGHVAKMVPDRITLQSMEKKSNEGFRQYAQRWMEVAVQVQPPLLEREMTMLFVNMLKAPFITYMLGSATKNFADIVMSGEMIESAVKSGKIDVGENNRRQNSKKKESEVNNVNTYNKSITVNQPRKVVAGQQGSSKQESGTRPRVTGHSIEHCTAFKKLVEKLIKMGVVKVDDSSGTENPLPNHADAGVNMVGEGTGKKVKENIAEVKIPLKRVWKEMVERGLIVSDLVGGGKTQNYCEFHHEMGHEIQRCEKFRALIQSMMDNGEIEFFEDVEGKKSICASESETRIPKVNHPVIIISSPKVTEVRAQVTVSGKETSISVAKENQKTESVEGKVLAAEQKKEKQVELRSLINEPIREEEATEFLKFLKHSEYSVVEQLHKQPARISVLALLMNSEIHSAGAVPSSLHQKLKLVSEGRLVTINAEEGIIASITSNTPYVETDEEAMECSFRTLEFVNATFIAKGNRIPVPKISRITRMGLQLMVGKGVVPGKELGRYLQGGVEAPMMKEKFDRFGLGYRLDIKQKRKGMERRQERRRARLSENEVRWEPMAFPHISKTFVSGGFIHPK